MNGNYDFLYDSGERRYDIRMRQLLYCNRTHWLSPYIHDNDDDNGSSAVQHIAQNIDA